MSGNWLLRWDTLRGEKPEVICAVEDRSGFLASFETNPESYVLFDGYLFDRADYQADLKATDATCIAAAYVRFGEDLFDELRGGYTLAIWDHQRRRLVAGRDAMGLNPCYYWWDGRIFILSPSIDRILAQPGVSAEFNRVLIAEFLQNIRPSQQRSETFYQDVKRLPPAHHLSLKEGRLSVSRYWDPLPPGFDWATGEELATFPQVLERAVDRCLLVGADSLALSGGFDSVSIAILAAEQRKGKNPLHAVSLRFPEGLTDEGATQMAVAQALGMPQTLRTVEDSLEGYSLIQGSLELSRINPCPVLSIWQSMYTGLLRSASSHGLHRLLMGTGGDEMLVVDLSYGADLFSAFDLRGLWRFYRAIARTSPFSSLQIARLVLWDATVKPGTLRWLSSGLDRTAPRLKAWLRKKKRPFTPATWISGSDPVLIQALDQRRLTSTPVELAPGEGAYVRAIRGLPQSSLLMLEMEQGGAWAKSAGFTLLYPYFDRDVVKLLLRVHPEHLIAGGREKTPLRRLVAERLPSVALPSKKVDFTQTVHELLRNGGQAAWQNLDGPAMLVEHDIIDADRIIHLMEDYFAGRNSNWVRTWLVLSTETWLRARSS